MIGHICSDYTMFGTVTLWQARLCHVRAL